MKTRLFSPDIECDSCVKVLTRVLKNNKDVADFNITTSYIDLTYVKKDALKHVMQSIREKGYNVSTSPIERPPIIERFKDFLKDKKKYRIEWRMLKYLVYMLLIAIVLQGIFVFVMNTYSPGFIATYLPWLMYLTVSVVFLGGAIWHFKAYRTTITCMTGMMIGMTIGMQTGMLIGAVIGITNGFFWGATVGMLLGSIVGMTTGSCCGIMGVIEGLMAGIMGGTMGAMITVMMFNNNIQYFLPLFIVLNIIVLIGFSYMLFEELVEGKDVHVQPISFARFLTLTTTTLAVLTALIVLLPASILLG